MCRLPTTRTSPSRWTIAALSSQTARRPNARLNSSASLNRCGSATTPRLCADTSASVSFSPFRNWLLRRTRFYCWRLPRRTEHDINISKFRARSCSGQRHCKDESYQARKKPLLSGSGFSQLFNSGFNQPTVYIHSFVIDSEVVSPKVDLWKYLQIFQITKFYVLFSNQQTVVCYTHFSF